MPNLKDIQRRIGSIKKTQQITRAMRMVSGAKLRRAQTASENARPYADRMRSTVSQVSQGVSEDAHPLFEQRESVKKVEFVVVVSDRGLCGGFNANALKFAASQTAAREAEGCEISITTAGKRGQDFFRRRRANQLEGNYPQHGWVTYGQATEIARAVSGRFISGEVDEVVLVYNEFVSAMTQRPKAVQLLPFTAEGETSEGALPYEIEPDPESLLAVLVPKAVEVEIYRALLENQTGEHAARMAAMEAATRNTEELVDTLTLQFNRARQAAITKELVEIVSGAEAL
ncbi:MAG: ATP synthase F1 subunit gamma [Deltaproteobacteria bacterium]|nr:ATP synthase F1 subunit gamma [Deltaproteobacteria bacterium]